MTTNTVFADQVETAANDLNAVPIDETSTSHDHDNDSCQRLKEAGDGECGHEEGTIANPAPAECQSSLEISTNEVPHEHETATTRQDNDNELHGDGTSVDTTNDKATTTESSSTPPISFFERYMERLYEDSFPRLLRQGGDGDHDEGTIHKFNPDSCTLYMAESAIPNAGWGMYTGIDLEKGDRVGTSDVVINSADINRNKRTRDLLRKDVPLERWLMHEYYWQASMTNAQYEARSVDSIIPAMGMLANSHTGLVNADNDGAKRRRRVISKKQRADQTSEGAALAGSATSFSDLVFTVNQDLPAGHELMVEYGDDWFEDREGVFGALPLSTDFSNADALLKKFKYEICDGALGEDNVSDLCRDLWRLIRDDLTAAMSPRMVAALPETLDDVDRIIGQEIISRRKYRNVPDGAVMPAKVQKGTAYYSVPNIVRSIPWLQEHGFCLDNIQAGPAQHLQYLDNDDDDDDIDEQDRHEQEGAMATRDIPAGAIIAPMPLVHLHRDHLKMFVTDKHDKTMVHWQGHQLLLNYVYGHPDSSVVLFPYSPVVNYLNHYNSSAPASEPNCKVRWSPSMSHPEWLDWTTAELMEENEHTGLMMELIALRDIAEGEELLLDYGSSWQEALDQHVSKHVKRQKDVVLTETKGQHHPQTNSDVLKKRRYPGGEPSYSPALEWDGVDPLPLSSSTEKINTQSEDTTPRLPDNLATFCFIDVEILEEEDDNGVWEYVPMKTKKYYIDDGEPCRILEVIAGTTEENKKTSYSYLVSVPGDKDENESQDYMVKNVPRSAIKVVDVPYSTDQFLRHSFRHYVELPDEMVPDGWRDLRDEREHQQRQCGLYLAQSSIPNAGLGMYSGKFVSEGQDISYGDLVVQFEDSKLNYKLRMWNKGKYDFRKQWTLLSEYYWNANNAAAQYEADDIDSIIPGFGMLANSHDGIVHADYKRAQVVSLDLDRNRDPGAGASTNFHGHQFYAFQDIEEGEEIFVEYGSSWFLDRKKKLGVIPVSDDYMEADEILKRFVDLVGGDVTSEMAKDLWAFWNMTDDDEDDSRVRKALPEKLEDVKHVAEIGTARYSLPNSIKSLEWLDEHGLCLDNLRPAKSTVGPQAGMGAFATRSLSKGQVISPAPLIHLKREDFEVYDSSDIDDEKAETWFAGEQVMMNYCFGHPQSSLLLFPYAPIVNYINHGDEPNAFVRWSEHPYASTHNEEWFDLKPKYLVREKYAGLMMEFVALRDIAEGEEVLIDYGYDWRTAWREHVQSWSPPNEPAHKSYVHPSVYNDYFSPVPTMDELHDNPYPPNIVTMCYVPKKLSKTANTIKTPVGDAYEWKYMDGMYETTKRTSPCDILDRDDTEWGIWDSVKPIGDTSTYTARVHFSKKKVILVTKIPRRAIEFFDDNYQSDQFVRTGFRHEIGLPLSMLPKTWRDLKRRRD